MTDLFHLLHDRNRFLTQDRLIYYLYSCLIHDYLYYPTSPWLSLSFKNSLSKSTCSCLSTGYRWQARRCTLEFHRAARHLPGVTQFPVVLEISILSNATASWIEMDGLFFRANNFDAFGESSTNRTVHPEKDNGNGFAKLDTNTFGHCLVPNNGFFSEIVVYSIPKVSCLSTRRIPKHLLIGVVFDLDNERSIERVDQRRQLL